MKLLRMRNHGEQERSEKAKGVWYTLGAFTLWGVLPLYWKALKQVPSPQILSHRILWSFIFVAILISLKGRWIDVKRSLSIKRNRISCSISALFISTNWFIYIWAVNAGHVVETSLGYFINPLISVLLGILFLKERLGFWKGVAVCLALVGVFYLTLQYGKLPWIALSLAVSFGMYGLLRKTAHVDSLLGLLIETAIITPIVLTYLVYEAMQGRSAFGVAPSVIHLLLIGSGVVTATPIIWFAHGARRIPLSMVGFIQYLAPSFQLVLAVLVFREPFTRTHLISFSLIWGALAIFSLSHTSWMKRIEPGIWRGRPVRKDN
jgi:chloramphenicol-sensitive protein RarD